MINIKGKSIKIIAGVMIACMAIVDASMFATLKNNKISASEEDQILENHELELAFADGIYDGENSSIERPNPGTVKDPNADSGSKGINILEIVPRKRQGVLGYTIGGCEPVLPGDNNTDLSDEDLRAAYMDAMVNLMPGSNNGNDYNELNNNSNTFRNLIEINNKMNEGSTYAPFNITTWSTYDGYYKYVGDNLGVYAIDRDDSGNYNIDVAGQKATMISRFDQGHAYKIKDNSYNYVWVEAEVGDDDKTTEDLKTIYVKNHKKAKYENNEKFLRDCYGIDGDLESAKEKYKFNVITREPTEVTDDDIANAGIIIIYKANDMPYYSSATTIYNIIHNTSDWGSAEFDRNNDFSSFDQVVKIYDRVVVKEDVAFITGKNTLNGTTFDTNMRKLMAMLFFVTKGDDWSYGSGRDMWLHFLKDYYDSDFLKSYFSQYPEINAYNEAGAATSTQIYDYIHIDRDGNFVRSDTYSGYYFDKIYSDDRQQVSWYSMQNSTWPWDDLRLWWFDRDRMNNQRTVEKYNDYFVNVQRYRARNGIDGSGSFKNTTIVQENDLFKGTNIKNAITDDIKKKIEENAGSGGGSGADIGYYISLNIYNGDGYNSESSKILYVNQYELDGNLKVPLYFRIKASTTSIYNIELLDSEGNEIPDVVVHLSGYEDKGEKKQVSDKLAPISIYEYTGYIEVDQERFGSFINQKFGVRATIEPISGTYKDSTDYMTISIRDFFKLN